MARLNPAQITRYTVQSPRWQAPPVSIAVISDLHIGAPWTTLDHLAAWVEQTNSLGVDLVVQAGDLLMDRNMWLYSSPASALAIARVLSGLHAPLGVWSVLGNHDWQDCNLARDSSGARNSVIEAFEEFDLHLLENRSVKLDHGGSDIHLVGLGSLMGPRFDRPAGQKGHDDLAAAFHEVPAGATSLLLAHEPDIFARHDGPDALQISGHTHGGQITFWGWRPVVPSDYGARFAYGHSVLGERQLIVSGGLGYSGLPLRIGVPPEILFIEISQGEIVPAAM